jgi:hypothetical protein
MYSLTQALWRIVDSFEDDRRYAYSQQPDDTTKAFKSRRNVGYYSEGWILPQNIRNSGDDSLFNFWIDDCEIGVFRLNRSFHLAPAAGRKGARRSQGILHPHLLTFRQ